MDLVGLVKELEKRKVSSFDLIAENRDIYAIANEDLGLMLGVLDRGRWPLTEWAHLQLAEKLEIPKKYYDKMRNARKFDLLAENVNAWLCTNERRLIRILDSKIRAILSDKYRIIDNYDLVFLALDEFKKKETVEIYRIDLTETMLYIKAIDRTLTDAIKEQDIVYGGEQTKYGLINAVTNLASQTRNVDEQIKLEEFGGQILQTSLKDFEGNVLGE